MLLSLEVAALSGHPGAQWLHYKLEMVYSASTPAIISSKVQSMMTVEQIKKRLEDANLKRVAENA